jgi:hypothetical protein
MSSAPIVDRIRIIPRPDDFLDRTVGASGEVFFNRATNSLRVYSGRDRGGFEIAKTDLSNISNAVFAAKATAAGIGGGSTPETGTSISVSTTAPDTPGNGNLWLNTTNGYLYVYVNDGTSSQWIQPAVPASPLPTLSTVAVTGNYSDLTNKPTLPGIATTQTAGIVKPGIGLAITQDGELNITGSIAFEIIDGLSFSRGVTISEFSNDATLADDADDAVPTEFAVKTYVDTAITSVLSNQTFTNSSLTGLTTLQQTSEVLNTKTAATGTVVHDFSTGAIFYHTSISSNFTANFTNVPTTNNRASSVVLVLVQGSTPRLPSTVQVDGVTQTIEWQGATVPTGTANQIDLVSFTLIRTGSAWTVLGSLTTYA